MTSGQTSTANASLKLGGSIEGTISDEFGPLDGGCVSAVDYTTGAQGGMTCAGSDGTFRLGGVPDGNYVLEFSGPWGSSYINEFWKDATYVDQATRVAMNGPEALTGFDATLGKGGNIQGTVTDASTGQAPSQPDVACLVSVWTLDDRYAGYACLDSNGSYLTSGLAPGDYKVQFGTYHGPFVEQWFDAQPDFESATPVTVTADTVTADVDAAMESVGPTGVLDGTVTSDSGEGLADVCAELYRWEGSSISYWDEACTDSDGVWSRRYIPPGNYKVNYEVYNLAFLPEWFNDAADQDSATIVTVGDGTTEHPRVLARSGGDRLWNRDGRRWGTGGGRLRTAGGRLYHGDRLLPVDVHGRGRSLHHPRRAGRRLLRQVHRLRR